MHNEHDKDNALPAPRFHRLRRGVDEYDDGAVEAGPGPESRGVSIGEYVAALKNHKWLLAAGAALGICMGVAVGLLQPVVYPAVTTIEVHGLNENFMNFSQVDAQAGSGVYSATASNIQTQIRILESVQIRERVVERLKLENLTSKPPSGGLINRIRLKLKLVSDQPLENSRKALKMAIDTTRAAGLRDTRIIEIRCMSTDPEVAATYLNTLVSEYIEQTMEFRSLNARKTSEWLVNQLQDTRERLAQIDKNLREFEQSTGYSASAPHESLAGSRTRQLQVELSAVQAERIAKQSRWDSARASTPEALPEVIDDAALRARQAQILELRRQLADLRTYLTPAHHQVKRVMAQLEQVQNEVEVDRKRALDRIRGEYEAALTKEKMLLGAYASGRNALSGESERAAQHQMLVREREVAQQTYNSMLQQVNHASMAAAVPATQVRPIDRARPRYDSPSAGAIPSAAMGLFCGILFAAGLIVVREAANRTVRTPRGVTELWSVPELASVPSIKSAERLEAVQKRRELKPAAPRLGLAASAADAGNGCWEDRPVLISESFRLAMTALAITVKDWGHTPVLVVTSPGPGEGKTFVTNHLGRAIAEAGKRVVLVDFDLRRPSLSREFKLPNAPGVCDVIRKLSVTGGPMDESVLRDAIVPSGVPGLSLLPAGEIEISGIPNLLHSPVMSSLITSLRRHYDFVLLDAVPLLAFSDARILARVSDGVLMVIRAGVTEKKHALLARQRLDTDATPVVGTILNDTVAGASETYHAYQGYYSNTVRSA